MQNDDIHNTDGPAFIFDPVTYFMLDVNDAFIDLYGYTLEEIKGMRVLQLRAENERPEAIKLMESTKGNILYSGESNHQDKVGRQFKVQVYGKRFYKDDKELYKVKVKLK